MRALVFVVQLLFWLMVVRLVLRAVGGLLRPGPRPRPAAGAPAAAPPRQIEDLVLDRVCRTYFPRSRGVAGRVDGRDQLFCSAACRDRAAAEAVAHV